MTEKEKHRKIELAREVWSSYGNADDLEIDEEAEVVEAEGGFWVEARVWVYEEDAPSFGSE